MKFSLGRLANWLGIQGQRTLNQNFEDIENNFKETTKNTAQIQVTIDTSKVEAAIAKTMAEEAKTKADSVQYQLNSAIIASGSSVAEVAQGRTNDLGITKTTLKERLDDDVKRLLDWANQRAINIRQPPYNSPANGVDDDSAIWQRAINDFFASSQQVNGYGGKTYMVPKIVVPNGRYLFNTQVSYNPTIPSGYLGDAVSLVIEGVGYGSTIIAGTTNTLFDFQNGTVHVSNIRMLGSAGKTGFKLGRNVPNSSGGLQVVSQSTFHRVSMFYFEKNFDIGQAFDTSWYECGFFSAKGTAPISFDIQAHETDNCNNLQFHRCHWEHTVNGTFFKVRGKNGSNTVHNNFGFFGCHFELRSFNSVILDLKYITRLKYITTQFTRNNVPTGQSAGVIESDTVPMFKLEEVHGLAYDTATISHIGSNGSSLPNKLFHLAGNISGVSFKNSFISTGINTANQGIDALWQADSVNPPTFPAGRFALLDGTTHIDDRYSAPVFSEMNVLTSSAQRNRKWVQKHNATTNALEWYYDSTTTGVLLGSPVAKQSKDGVFAPISIGGAFMQTVTNGSSATFSPSFDNNANKRGIYKVMADYTGDAFALFYSTGTQVYPIFVGAACTLGATNANTSGKLNIYLSNLSIVVNNQLGSDRKVSIAVEGFY